jgi:aspartate 1-decarboxylase
MKKNMLGAKIHRATVTGSDLHYEGSCAIDEDLIDAAGMDPFEKIDIYNINTGERFETYIITAPRGTGTLSLNGAAARKAVVGDLVIVCSYIAVEINEIKTHKPKIVMVDGKNHLVK